MNLVWRRPQMLCLRFQRVHPGASLGGLSLSHHLLHVSHSDHHISLAICLVATKGRVPYDFSGACDVSNPSLVYLPLVLLVWKVSNTNSKQCPQLVTLTCLWLCSNAIRGRRIIGTTERTCRSLSLVLKLRLYALVIWKSQAQVNLRTIMRRQGGQTRSLVL